jgi:hypothetical protein
VLSAFGCGQRSVWTSSADGKSGSTMSYCPVAGGLHVVSESTTEVVTVPVVGTQTISMSYTCDAGAFLPVTSGKPGQTWTWTCNGSDGSKTTQKVTLVGKETVSVAGRSVPTEHVKVEGGVAGSSSISGSVDQEYWFSADALAVKETGRADASESGYSFTSNYTLLLKSPTPTP